jgi:hypothetical protein
MALAPKADHFSMTAKLSAAARTRIVEPRMFASAHPQAMLFMNVL